MKTVEQINQEIVIITKGAITKESVLSAISLLANTPLVIQLLLLNELVKYNKPYINVYDSHTRTLLSPMKYIGEDGMAVVTDTPNFGNLLEWLSQVPAIALDVYPVSSLISTILITHTDGAIVFDCSWIDYFARKADFSTLVMFKSTGDSEGLEPEEAAFYPSVFIDAGVLLLGI